MTAAGGSSATGGTPGAGGAPGGTTGSGGPTSTGGSSGANATSGMGGCSCELAGSNGSPGELELIGLVLARALLVFRRRRDRRSGR